jgi:hypothetical protein
LASPDLARLGGHIFCLDSMLNLWHSPSFFRRKSWHSVFDKSFSFTDSQQTAPLSMPPESANRHGPDRLSLPMLFEEF